MGGGISRGTLREHIPSLPGSYHCAMIGLDSAGKTTVLYRLKFKQYVNAAPTIGFNTEKVKLNGSTFTVWDVGGQDKLRPLWRSYARCTDGIIFVVDSTKEERLEEAKVELQKICKSTTGVAAGVRNKKQHPRARAGQHAGSARRTGRGEAGVVARPARPGPGAAVAPAADVRRAGRRAARGHGQGAADDQQPQEDVAHHGGGQLLGQLGSLEQQECLGQQESWDSWGSL